MVKKSMVVILEQSVIFKVDFKMYKTNKILKNKKNR